MWEMVVFLDCYLFTPPPVSWCRQHTWCEAQIWGCAWSRGPPASSAGPCLGWEDTINIRSSQSSSPHLLELFDLKVRPRPTTLVSLRSSRIWPSLDTDLDMFPTLFTPWSSPEMLTTLDFRLSLRMMRVMENISNQDDIYNLRRDDLQTLQEQSRSSSDLTDITLDLRLWLRLSHLLTLRLRPARSTSGSSIVSLSLCLSVSLFILHWVATEVHYTTSAKRKFPSNYVAMICVRNITGNITSQTKYTTIKGWEGKYFL